MDGARIVSYEIGSVQELDLPQYIRDAQENGWTVRTIPLSLCAIAPEMREALKKLSGAHLCDSHCAELLDENVKCIHAEGRALLSRID